MQAAAVVDLPAEHLGYADDRAIWELPVHGVGHRPQLPVLHRGELLRCERGTHSRVGDAPPQRVDLIPEVPAARTQPVIDLIRTPRDVLERGEVLNVFEQPCTDDLDGS